MCGPAVYDDGVLRMTATGRPPLVAIIGEIDEDTYPALVAMLTELARLTEIHLNLAGVQYCDLAGLRAIVQMAGASGYGTYWASSAGTPRPGWSSTTARRPADTPCSGITAAGTRGQGLRYRGQGPGPRSKPKFW
jgi:hypothetical protein